VVALGLETMVNVRFSRILGQGGAMREGGVRRTPRRRSVTPLSLPFRHMSGHTKAGDIGHVPISRRELPPFFRVIFVRFRKIGGSSPSF
jgi:hypothetical protein